MAIKKLLFLLLSVIVYTIHRAEADYLLGIRIHNYSNPTNQCPTCSIERGHHCCDTMWPNGTCAECNTYFYYCLQGLNDLGECTDGRISYEYTERGKTYLDFRGGLLLKLPNPYLYWGPTKSWIGTQVYLAVYDKDDEDRRLDDVLYNVSINLTTGDIPFGNGMESTPLTYTGPMGYSSIVLSYSVVCAENWYGPDCSEWCQGDHCLCDLSIACHDNCLGVICGDNAHCVDGVNTFTCVCDNGFTGANCEAKIDNCKGVDCGKHGHCVDELNSFLCVCEIGYTGQYCNEATLIWLIASGVVGWFLVVILLIVTAFVQFKRYHSTPKPNSHDKCLVQDLGDTTIRGMHPLPNISYGQVREDAISSMECTTYESIDESYCHYEN